MIEIGKGNAERGMRSYRLAQSPSARSFHFRLSPFHFRRRALTLVELMVAIAIIGILASLLLGAAAVASEVARNARTKSLIARLHTLVIERYDGYRNHRVEIQPFTDTAVYRTSLAAVTGFVYPTGPNGLNPPQPGGPGDPRMRAYARLAGLRELMKLEMPDRWSDILNGAVQNPPQIIPPSSGRPGVVLQRVPALYETYARAYNQLVGRTNTVTGLPNTDDDILANESAECLYLIIMNATGDGEARGMFKPNDIGDTDGDGAFEFLDGWGKPIAFLRWAPGFDSDAQLSFRSLERTASNPRLGPNVVAEQLLEDHDPFDLFRLDPPAGSGLLRGWRLTPLIISGGGDEEIGVRTLSGANYIATLNPYADVLLGEATDTPDDAARDIEAELAGDDITNHNVGELSRK
ncbi:type II secretion system protein [Botrimarina mediterranea]|uniref:Type II secretion system protein G n=1 Tax=Botrimarina mediterranea TaxID=2528022 RepID=A0A518K328_9BACT|nr:prepilin-type N-terminal cleavage/methylation domain-containing protein [Botrimarina mediterranea]QDV72155.1 hypothetical protein Spa11_03270 [Botrimarina mediterranea]QDV76697.1 hypothetical protein K2D_02780 [Planctomycetes bacterium K2D]